MTKKELQQVYHMKNEIKMWEADLYALSDIKAVSYGSVSHGNDISKPAQDITERRDKLIRLIEHKKNEIDQKVCDITQYIMSVDDSLMRQILYKRHVELKSWPRIAKEIGTTPDSLRVLHDRFLKKQ